MNAMVLSESRLLGRDVCLCLESLSEAWRCRAVTDAVQAAEALREGVEVMILYPGVQTECLLAALSARPPLASPWLLGSGVRHAALDGAFSLTDAAQAAQTLLLWEQAGRLPRLATVRLPEVTCLARGMLRALSVPPRLRAQEFLPDMAAMTVLHPSLLEGLSQRLYPLVARRHGRSCAAVERSLRLCVESVWTSGQLRSLERFFGHSVDPERGKPTNREFLCCLQQRLTLAARRIC